MKTRIYSLTTLIFFLITACSQNSNQTNITSSECPDTAQSTLENSNVKPISLTNQTITQSGIASSNKSIGYSFEAQSGQKLSYTTNQNICIWIYTPDNQILNDVVLPMTGKYTIQISAPRGNTTFDLAMNLETITEVSQSTSLVSNQLAINSTRKSASISSIKPTPILSTPSPSVTPLTSQSDNLSRLSPKKAIENYYAQINNHQYQDAWNIYPPAVKENKQLHPDGYNSYIDWWQKVDFVDINQIDVEKYNDESAIVSMSSKYRMKNGRKIPVSLKFYMIWDNLNQDWKVIKIKHNKLNI
ncbi:hypothetical protein [Anabaena sp. CA = ATCC 33047]|uniref:hypothetical protein n=1 Tax=Anabaena sp. (strain CA / ATCC 33047) TaxID=52271 RepID=UPI000829B170|nr:hypothetical protein [Anabaena sp. CA = ATCC 33047]